MDSNTKLCLEELSFELSAARAQHGPMRSAHEGYAVILEEVDELWMEVCKKRSARSRSKLRQEALQIAAMACRFVLDVVDNLPPDDTD